MSNVGSVKTGQQLLLEMMSFFKDSIEYEGWPRDVWRVSR